MIRQQAPVKRLDPKWIAGQLELEALFQRVYHCDGEHSAQFGKRFHTELGPQLRDDLPSQAVRTGSRKRSASCRWLWIPPLKTQVYRPSEEMNGWFPLVLDPAWLAECFPR